MATDEARMHRDAECVSPYGRIHVLWRGYTLVDIYSDPLCAAVNVQSAGTEQSCRSYVTAICFGMSGTDTYTYTVIYR